MFRSEDLRLTYKNWIFVPISCLAFSSVEATKPQLQC